MRFLLEYFIRFGGLIATRLRYALFRVRQSVHFDTSAPLSRSLIYFTNALLYLFPSRKIFVIGVVGAESTAITAELIHHLILGMGKKASLLSRRTRVISHRDGLTTENRLSQVEIQQFLSAIGKRQAEYAIIELEIEDLWSQTYLYTNFDLVLVTGFHALHKRTAAPVPAADYESAIAGFLQGITRQRRKYGIRKTLVLNMDDPQMALFSVRGDYRTVGYAARPVENSWVDVLQPARVERLPHGAKISLNDELSFETNLRGENGISVSLAALAVMKELHADLSALGDRFKTFRGTPGHFERFHHGQAFEVIADGAKTVEELADVLPVAQSAANQKPYGLLICILGADGSDAPDVMRAKTELAVSHCNRLFLTVDYAGGQAPTGVLRAFVESLPADIQGRHSTVIFREFLDRRRAIESAIASARDQDVVLALGKINDATITGQDGKTIPWDERKVILASIADRLRSK